MSDRFVFQATKEEVEHQFKVHSEREDYFESHFNITPGSLISAVYREEGQRKINNFIWGLIPPDAENERSGAENYEVTLGEIQEEEWKIECLEKRRCLIPASGFYKWKTTKKKNTPFYIRLLSNQLMALAGIYTVWKSSSGRDVYSCSMLTTEANALVQPVGERMPVIIDREYHSTWLGEDALDERTLDRLIQSYPMSQMAVNRVSEEVNDKENDDPQLIQPIPK
ncbi:SOS response-associated peptidase [Fodinibius sediminis]|uniref:Abasic site processing protein n=1 Tax=Fodinibius sediminis TaxID=1214077 RepID=A0A521ARJ1_9BACT|nr:SOS response-associated peptidase [Fodinibius sediminis]SMO37432.1 Putative SOS response-associated peptidase YedK [Fodinibius sediminis]